MKMKLLLCLTLVLGGLDCSTQTGRADENVITPSSDTPKVVAGNTAFAVDLYGKLRTQEGNVFFSPYSISTALAMTYGGARGETENQMAQTLHFNLAPDKLHPAFAAMEANLNAVQQSGQIKLATA